MTKTGVTYIYDSQGNVIDFSICGLTELERLNIELARLNKHLERVNTQKTLIESRISELS
jgi:uncharacterized protein with ATP-grasp and redox domains